MSQVRAGLGSGRLKGGQPVHLRGRPHKPLETEGRQATQPVPPAQQPRLQEGLIHRGDSLAQRHQFGLRVAVAPVQERPARVSRVQAHERPETAVAHATGLGPRVMGPKGILVALGEGPHGAPELRRGLAVVDLRRAAVFFVRDAAGHGVVQLPQEQSQSPRVRHSRQFCVQNVAQQQPLNGVQVGLRTEDVGAVLVVLADLLQEMRPTGGTGLAVGSEVTEHGQEVGHQLWARTRVRVRNALGTYVEQAPRTRADVAWEPRPHLFVLHVRRPKPPVQEGHVQRQIIVFPPDAVLGLLLRARRAQGRRQVVINQPPAPQHHRVIRVVVHVRGQVCDSDPQRQPLMGSTTECPHHGRQPLVPPPNGIRGRAVRHGCHKMP